MPFSTMRTLLVLGSLGIVTAVVGYGMGAHRSADAKVGDAPLPPEAPPRDDKLGELQRKVARLQRTLGELSAKKPSADFSLLQEQLAALEARLDGLGQGDHELGQNPVAGLTENEQRAVERAKTDVLIAWLEDQFQAEPRNEAWAAAIESSIGSTLKTEAGVVPSHVECQTKLCKVEMTHKDREAEDLFLHKLVHVRALGDTEAFLERHEHEDGTISTLTYLTGEGKHLPEAPVL
jgi:hypothetical protein